MSEDADLLDVQYTDGSDCAWSEGGDSLLDSEDEDRERECLSPPLPHVQPLSTSQRPDSHSFSAQGKNSETTGICFPQSRPHSDVGNTERSRVIRLDGQKRFRCVPDTLPDVPLTKRTFCQRRAVTGKPRRITKPSLLLEPARLTVSGPHTDLRNTLVANRRSRLKYHSMCGDRLATDTSTERAAGLAGHSSSHQMPQPLFSTAAATTVPPSLHQPSSAGPVPGKRIVHRHTDKSVSSVVRSDQDSGSLFARPVTVTGARGEGQLLEPVRQFLPCLLPTSQAPPTSNAGDVGRAPIPQQPLTSPNPQTESVNPFYAKMQELPSYAPEDYFNPFFTALEREEAKQDSSDIPDDHTLPFSFSLTQITS